MKIEQLRILDGPNYWSIKRKKLIFMRLNIEAMKGINTNRMPGFFDRLQATLPSLNEHSCTREKPGGFFERVQLGTSVAHVIEHIALALQQLAGMNTVFGRTRHTGERGIYNIIFSYVEAGAGQYAANAAVNIAEALIKGEAYDLQKDIDELRDIWLSESFGPSTGSLVDEAVRRGIPVVRIDGSSIVQLGYGKNQKRISATIASTTSSIAVDIAGDKKATKKILEEENVPVPKGGIAFSEEKLKTVIDEIGYPVVIKPRDGNQGKGATTNINTWDEAVVAFKAAKCFSRCVICEQYITGDDYRALVINYKFVAAAMRKPAAVTGNGKDTIQELIDFVNSDPRRGNGHENVMTRIKVDEATRQILAKKGLTLETVLPKGQELWLKTTANLSTGGTATDVSDTVHPKNISLFNRIARIIGLDICGIDVMATDLSTPIAANGGAVIEVNAAPGFRMHLQPSEGKPRNVAAPVLDMLFPKHTSATIPIIAVTGTNGKTTTSRLIAHMCRQQGFITGYTTTEGIYIQNEKLVEGDCSGPASARFVLKDSSVEMAVLECARGGILRGGLGFNECDVAVVTNVAEDHLGLGGINTIEQLAKVKSVVPETAKQSGYAILNADDDLVLKMRNNLRCKVALFSLNANNPEVEKHCEEGGLAAVCENNYLYIYDGFEKIKVEKTSNIPITFNGKAEFNTANVLAAVLAVYARKFSIESIKKSLLNFIPSPEPTPGRMNIFNFNDFTVMVDYAHNPHGVRAIGKFIQSVNASCKVGIISGVGDRRDEDLVALGAEAAPLFDEVIVRMDDYLRGRTMDEIFQLVSTGIKAVDGNKKITLIPDEDEALRTAIANAKPQSFIVVLTDKIDRCIETTRCLLEQDRKQAEVRQLQGNTYENVVL
jgi:cyanophycin synthetase